MKSLDNVLKGFKGKEKEITILQEVEMLGFGAEAQVYQVSTFSVNNKTNAVKRSNVCINIDEKGNVDYKISNCDGFGW